MTKKRSLCLSLMLALIGQMSALGAGGIHLISQEHHVWGSAGFPVATSYDETSTNSLHGSVTGILVDPYGGSEIPLDASSDAGDFEVQTCADGYFFAEAFAQSTYVFRPQADVRRLMFELGSWGYGVGIFDETNIQFTLDDLTAGTSMASLVAPSQPDWEIGPQWYDDWAHTYTDTYAVDPTHTYGMTLFAYAGHGDGGRVAFLDVNVVPIPAPGALLLACIGAAFAAKGRRRPIRSSAQQHRSSME